jgi:hypothetical protein
MEVTYLYPIKSNEVPTIEVEKITDIKNLLQTITKKIEPLIKQLEFSIQQHKTQLQDGQDRQRLLKLVNKWNENCRRLGATPISPFQCRINTEEGYYYWQYSYHPRVAISEIDPILRP